MKITGKKYLRVARGRINFISNEDFACLSIALYYIWQAGNLFVQKCLNSTLFVLGMYLVLFAGVGIAVVSAARTKAAYWLLAELLVMVSYTFSYLLGNAEIKVLIYNFAWTFVICVPIALCILCINKMDRLLRMLYLMAKPLLFLLCSTVLLKFVILKTNLGQYDESLSYSLVFWCIILCNEVLENMKLMDLLFLFVGLAFNLLWGSRGTYICFILFVLLKVLFDIKSQRKKRLLIFGGGAAVFLGIVLLIAAQMSFSGDDSGKLIYFRSLYKLLSGEMFQSDSRIALYVYYLGLILQKPLIGWGVTGGWQGLRLFPHNFFIEVFLSYGILIGTALGFYSLFLFGCVLLREQKCGRTLFLIYFSNAFALIVSGTFLQNTSFYMCIFLGMCCLKGKLGGKYNE